MSNTEKYQDKNDCNEKKIEEIVDYEEFDDMGLDDNLYTVLPSMYPDINIESDSKKNIDILKSLKDLKIFLYQNQ